MFEKGKKQNRVAVQEGRVGLPVGALILIFPLVSLTTLAKIVTYTPYPCPSSVQYASQCGRRVVPKFRRLANKKAVFAEPAARLPVARSVAPPDYFKRLTDVEDPELTPNLHFTSGLTPLRSPPLIQDRREFRNRQDQAHGC